MANYSGRLADGTKILMKRELAAGLADLRREALRSKNARLNLVIFRLAACCGLRASEVANLQMADERIELPRPHLRIRASAAKGGKPRTVPLWWDRGTYEDIVPWRADRLARGAKPSNSFVCSWQEGRNELAFSRHTLRKRFRTASKIPGSNDLVLSPSIAAGIRLLAMP
jgi:integrase